MPNFPGVPKGTHLPHITAIRQIVTAAQLFAAGGVITLGTLEFPTVAVRVTSNVTTPFAAGTTLAVGTQTNNKTGTVGLPSVLQAAGAAAGQLNAPAAGIYAAIPMYDMPDVQDIVLTAGGTALTGASVGQVEILIEFYALNT